MTICIAGICRHEAVFAFVLCADFQGTRGDYIKAEDTHKVWHFHGRRGAIMFAGDAAVGAEFFREFQSIAAEFEKIEKPDEMGDFDIRVGEYLAKVRGLTSSFIKERINDTLNRTYGISLQDFYSPSGSSRFSPKLYDEIAETVKSVSCPVVLQGCP
jgi:hypothetical protein